MALKKEALDLKKENSALYYPDAFLHGAGASTIKFSAYERKTRSTNIIDFTLKNNKENTLLKEIFLFMPERALAPNSTSWDGGGRLGIIGGLGTNAFKQIAGAMTTGSFSDKLKAVGDVGENLLEQGVGAGMSYAGFNLAAYALQSAGADLGSNGGDMLMGVMNNMIPNPHVTLLFRGVDLRTFEFQFKLYPHDISERDTIQKIVTCFRGFALPNFAEGTEQFLQYPPFFTIEYFYDGEENQYLPKFKKSALIYVDVDYTASGAWSITRDGFPTEIVLTLRFMEEEIVLQDDVLDQGY